MRLALYDARFLADADAGFKLEPTFVMTDNSVMELESLSYEFNGMWFSQFLAFAAKRLETLMVVLALNSLMYVDLNTQPKPSPLLLPLFGLNTGGGVSIPLLFDGFTLLFLCVGHYFKAVLDRIKYGPHYRDVNKRSACFKRHMRGAQLDAHS